ncbi:TPA: hypothetical protein N0F65_007480 [Lagenidium giganteum]|uniref:Ribosomal RNA-processing protein 7 C-terminal domain-containing protein n=1 Tax=Lagenidium giganteum TaxID=4803 RepID=A0AAV2ZEI0_9STRA|nr:TPA: hypothetical protein N0F65_007480 [Lagenidium giganteum]
MTMALVGGYHPIALPLAHSVFHRYIYVKKHVAKESEKHGESILAADRTVYVANLPSTSDADWLRDCLGGVGAIQHIEEHAVMSKDQDSLLAKTAHVVFKSKKSVDQLMQTKALECVAKPSIKGLKCECCVQPAQSFKAKYQENKPGLAAVMATADEFMAKFDAEEESELRRREELKNQVDDDGFVTVVNTKRKNVVPEEDLARPAKKQKSKELTDFYRFQVREKKRDQLKTLRERFEEDRQMVEKLKKANKFRPE